MTDLRKAAEMALEALQKIYIAPEHEEYIRVWWPKCEEAIQALRQALSNEFNPDWNQVEALQESLREHMSEIQRLRQALAQPEQEQYVTKVVAIHEDGTYTTERITMPKREWVGLTDDEIEEYKWMGRDVIAVIKEIQATLKEKNT